MTGSQFATSGRTVSHRVIRLMPAILTVVMCAACSDFWVSDSSIATVTVSPNALLLKAAASATTPGDAATISASATTVGNQSADTSGVTWTSSDPTVATVTGGKVTVVGTTSTTAVITASLGGQSATCNILTYTGTAPTTITVNIPSGIATGNLAPGQTFQLHALAALNGSSNQTDISNYVTWGSSNSSVGTISTTGLVTVLSTATAGSAFSITATANLASGPLASPAVQFSVTSGLF